MTNAKAISILGSTGSIGTQTLDIVRSHPDKFRVVGMAAGRNIQLLAEQVREFHPEIVATSQESLLPELKSLLQDLEHQPQIIAGKAAIAEVARYGDAESVVTGLWAVLDFYRPLRRSKPAKTLLLLTKKP